MKEGHTASSSFGSNTRSRSDDVLDDAADDGGGVAPDASMLSASLSPGLLPSG